MKRFNDGIPEPVLLRQMKETGEAVAIFCDWVVICQDDGSTVPTSRRTCLSASRPLDPTSEDAQELIRELERRGFTLKIIHRRAR